MKRFLEKVGVSQLALDNISNIVQSCPVCREWAKPGPANVGTTSAPDKFNQQVECDLLEFNHLDDKEHHRVLHLVDRCTRWQATTEVPNKEEDTLLQAIEKIWIGIFGPPKELLTDGEGGISLSESTRAKLSRHGISVHTRAKDQHARYAERRGAFLRDTIHRMYGQMREEGILLPFESVLSEATFCGNALITVGGNTPYNAVMGRVPAMLPSIDHIRSPAVTESGTSTLEHTHIVSVRSLFRRWLRHQPRQG